MAVYLLLCIIIALLFDISKGQSCTSYDDETGTCYIERKQKWNLSHGNISCDPNYPHCVITCFGDPYSCGSKEYALYRPYLILSNHSECTINCNSNEACYGSIMNVSLCSFVNININGMDQSSMEIYAPHNDDGNLFVDLLNEQTSFTNNKILCSSANCGSIIIDCELGRSCNKNIIKATQLSSTLQYKCHNYCDSTDIYCPTNNGECNIQCKDSCNNMLIHTNDMNKLQFFCDDKQCQNTIIQCTINDTLYPCSAPDSVVMVHNDLNLYMYYNESRKYDVNLYSKLMHDTFIETFHIIHHNIFGDLINITFNTASNRKRLFKSQYMTHAILYITSSTDGIELFEEYLIDIISSDKFLQYFSQNMNIKLKSQSIEHELWNDDNHHHDINNQNNNDDTEPELPLSPVNTNSITNNKLILHTSPSSLAVSSINKYDASDSSTKL